MALMGSGPVRSVAVHGHHDAPAGYSLTMDQCWALLDTGDRGTRRADRGRPSGDLSGELRAGSAGRIVFRTAGGTKLWGAVTAKPVAFEIDGYDAHDETAWSVVARGDAEVIESQEEKDAVDALLLEPWQPGEKDLLRAGGAQGADRTALQGQPA